MRHNNQKTIDGLTILTESLITVGAIAVAVGLTGCGTSRTVARHQDPFLSQEAGAATVAIETEPSATGVVSITSLGPDNAADRTAAAAAAAEQQTPSQAGTPGSSVELAADSVQQSITQTNHAAEAGSMPSARLADHVESQSSRRSLKWADYDPFLQDHQGSAAATRKEIAIARAEALIEASEQPVEKPNTTRQASAEASRPAENEEKPVADTVMPEASESVDVKPQPAIEKSTPEPTSLHPLLKAHDGQFSWQRLD